MENHENFGNVTCGSRQTAVRKVQRKEAPAILAAGMLGDRASVVFASPEEISQFIKPRANDVRFWPKADM